MFHITIEHRCVVVKRDVAVKKEGHTVVTDRTKTPDLIAGGGRAFISTRMAGVGFFGGTLRNISSLKQLELDVWAMEREVAAIKASLTTLTYEVQRFSMLCEEKRGAKESLKKKLNKIKEFDDQRLELKSICDGFMKANIQPLAAREFDYYLNLAFEQEEIIRNKWLPEEWNCKCS
uniref:Augmin subunit 5-like n=1 Tax=Tanacetum cinerariifolium TaxID=118510 RepID=A0A6L2K7S3_TANCI|nr:augmin subunit 5-like [Tanacetum cinerariifolium]